MDLSIVIVNWNTSSLLLQCLDSIYNTGSQYSFEVIVIDNSSSDDSVTLVEKNFPAVILIRNQQNLGFARANNQGLLIARGRYYMLLNSDTIVLPGAIDKLVQAAECNPHVGVVGPKLLNMNGTVQESWASFPSFLSELTGKNFRFRQPVQSFPFSYDVDWIMGACMLVRAKTVAEVGNLDEDYFFYSEELDWCFRIKKKNWKIWYLADAEVYHLGGGSTNRGSFAQLFYLYQGKILYFQKHHGVIKGAILRYGLALGNTLGVIRRVIFFDWKNKKVAYQRIANQMKLVWFLVLNRSLEPGAAL